MMNFNRNPSLYNSSVPMPPISLCSLAKILKCLVDNDQGKHDTGSGPNRSHEIDHHREGIDAQPTESGRRRDVPVLFVGHRAFPVAAHDHLLSRTLS
ncbi:hypothetical protein RP20_CCG008564 [Aedes albopictus]|nr:hypothetical protein RP20_CCG008564 [Aedes albopictus]